jgi:hypothetical protein
MNMKVQGMSGILQREYIYAYTCIINLYAMYFYTKPFNSFQTVASLTFIRDATDLNTDHINFKPTYFRRSMQSFKIDRAEI